MMENEKVKIELEFEDIRVFDCFQRIEASVGGTGMFSVQHATSNCTILHCTARTVTQLNATTKTKSDHYNKR